MDCNDVSCPYITGSNVHSYECVKPFGEKCDRFDNDGIPDCDGCCYLVDVGCYRTFCSLGRCIDAD